MISKLITVAQTREEAIQKMKRALDEYIIEELKTNSFSSTTFRRSKIFKRRLHN